MNDHNFRILVQTPSGTLLAEVQGFKPEDRYDVFTEAVTQAWPTETVKLIGDDERVICYSTVEND